MTEDIHELKQEEQANEVDKSNHNRLAGLALVVLGLYFLLNNYFQIRLFENWWALFILIPAAANLNNAWRHYREAGQWTEAATNALTGGLLIAAVAMIFLLGLSFGTFWPILLVIIGFGILVRRA